MEYNQNAIEQTQEFKVIVKDFINFLIDNEHVIRQKSNFNEQYENFKLIKSVSGEQLYYDVPVIMVDEISKQWIRQADMLADTAMQELVDLTEHNLKSIKGIETDQYNQITEYDILETVDNVYCSIVEDNLLDKIQMTTAFTQLPQPLIPELLSFYVNARKHIGYDFPDTPLTNEFNQVYDYLNQLITNENNEEVIVNTIGKAVDMDLSNCIDGYHIDYSNLSDEVRNAAFPMIVIDDVDGRHIENGESFGLHYLVNPNIESVAIQMQKSVDEVLQIRNEYVTHLSKLDEDRYANSALRLLSQNGITLAHLADLDKWKEHLEKNEYHKSIAHDLAYTFSEDSHPFYSPTQIMYSVKMNLTDMVGLMLLQKLQYQAHKPDSKLSKEVIDVIRNSPEIMEGGVRLNNVGFGSFMYDDKTTYAADGAFTLDTGVQVCVTLPISTIDFKFIDEDLKNQNNFIPHNSHNVFQVGRYADMDLLTSSTGESNLVILSEDHLAKLDNANTFINISEVEIKELQNKNNSRNMRL